MGNSVKKIVLTGCSGSGKSTIWELLRSDYLAFPEVATELISSGLRAPISSENASKSFPSRVLERRIQHFVHSENSIVSVFDRGIPDALGFSYYLKKEAGSLLLKAISEYRYTHILVFPPWKEIFTNDNVRKESFEVAEEIYEHIVAAYTNSGYDMTIVPKLDVTGRLKFIKNFISKS